MRQGVRMGINRLIVGALPFCMPHSGMCIIIENERVQPTDKDTSGFRENVDCLYSKYNISRDVVHASMRMIDNICILEYGTGRIRRMVSMC